ncbi:aldose epimerase family protein [Lentilactobacillus sp. Marseille-Q4993]|uniref:aldose epimerase family protein n=1 Tax=Lentilactobacillus sp. Marseille-Q4993 TaxID=3039492 RepID=UPI0024BBFE7D|nr:aldose epimerase family protein [Lentilactobacillus sp. Marseille-Q4993]
MKKVSESFGQVAQTPITKYTLTNDNGVSISAITLGATITGINIPTKDGGTKNIVLSFDNVQSYIDNHFFLCQAIGRTAGRISKGTFEINGKSYQVDPNENETTLHGGPHGFSTLVWDGEFHENSIIFTKHIASDIDSFPGNLTVQIEFSLSEDDKVLLKYTATSDADTLFNPTQHLYLNLSDENNALSQTISVTSNEHLELSSEKTPTGNFLPVENTPYDLRQPKQIGQAIEELKAQEGHSFDEIFHIDNHLSEEPIAILADNKSGRKMSLFSTRNGLVVFTPGGWDSSVQFADGAGEPFKGIALEAQTLPDSPNHQGFGDVSLLKGETRTETIGIKLEY